MLYLDADYRTTFVFIKHFVNAANKLQVKTGSHLLPEEYQEPHSWKEKY